MPDLFLHDRKVRTIFDLLGHKENDITYSVGWAIAKCDVFLALLIGRLFPDHDIGNTVSIHLQQSAEQGGYTDIEIRTEHIHIIIEAKRGWNLPLVAQLEKYAKRFTKGETTSAIVVMAECTPAYAESILPEEVMGIPIHYMSWKQVAAVSSQSLNSGTHADKRLLRELSSYLEGLMSMQNQRSNMVYVVVLGQDTPVWSSISWRKIVTDRNRYFHPFGVGGWPKEPPNYIGFRYGSKLRSIHHIDHYEVVADVTEISAEIPEIDGEKWRSLDKNTHFLYTLGPPIIPDKEIKTGSIYPNGRVWAMLDLLLTCETISEARDLTKMRLKNEEEI